MPPDRFPDDTPQKFKHKLARAGKRYTIIARGNRLRARIRFPGVFQGQEIVWDATVLNLRARPRELSANPSAPFIDIGDHGPHGIQLTVGLNVTEIDEPTLLKTVIMIQNYKRLRPGRHEFGAAIHRKRGRRRWRLEKILSGGQTGVDRAALDTALALGIPCGGWCPRGRRAEDGIIPQRYPLEETNARDYRQRTARNLRAADGTLILACGPLRGGTALTKRIAEQEGKPFFVVDLTNKTSPETVRDWIAREGLRTLNVAGPRASQQPESYRQARRFLRRVLLKANVPA